MNQERHIRSAIICLVIEPQALDDDAATQTRKYQAARVLARMDLRSADGKSLMFLVWQACFTSRMLLTVISADGTRVRPQICLRCLSKLTCLVAMSASGTLVQ